MGYRLIHRPWRVRKPFYISMVFELAGLVPLLVLFGIAQPDMYRTRMWQVGFDNGFNSNPNMILYAYANHRPLPAVPFVWSQTITNFNVAISVISLFLLLAKMILTIMHVFYPIMGTFVAISMTALYATSVYGQAGPDYADARYPSPVAWYISKSCDYARRNNAYQSCMFAKGTFAVTCYMLFIYVVNVGFAIYSMWPNKNIEFFDDDDEDGKSSSPTHDDKQWEMQPQTPRSTPFTPRTQAFNTLDRKLPLRSQYA